MAASKAKKKKGASPERRAGADRRTAADRRDFPRPEGRRKGGGRRADDPKDA